MCVRGGGYVCVDVRKGCEYVCEDVRRRWEYVCVCRCKV